MNTVPTVPTADRPANKPFMKLVWAVIAVIGAIAFGTLALHRGESINAVWLVVAAFCTYSIAYRFYSLFWLVRCFMPNLTPPILPNVPFFRATVHQSLPHARWLWLHLPSRC